MRRPPRSPWCDFRYRISVGAGVALALIIIGAMSA